VLHKRWRQQISAILQLLYCRPCGADRLERIAVLLTSLERERIPSLRGSAADSQHIQSHLPFTNLYEFLFSLILATCPAHLILLALITLIILGEEYKSLSSSLCSFLHPPVISLSVSLSLSLSLYIYIYIFLI
jgi:hypothetical protein